MTMVSFMKFFRVLSLFLIAASISSAQSIPPVKAKALDDSEVTLPNPSNPKILILVLGFSHKSGDLCDPWFKKLAADFHNEARVSYFSLPLLQNAPSFVRPMILRGMRKNTPKEELAHFVPLYSNEAEWKKFVNFSATDDPYLVVATPDGHPAWQAHSAFSDNMYDELRKSVAALLEKGSAAAPAHP